MGFDLHTVEVLSGSTALSNPDRLKFGMITLAVSSVIGQMTAGVVDAVGSGYTSIPTATAAGGTGGTIAPSMAIATFVAAPAAAGTTYAPSDTITLTGGTAGTQGILEVQTTTIVTAPVVVAGGTGYVVGDQITCQDGVVLQVATVSTTAVATVTIVNGGSFTANVTSAGGLIQASTTGVGTGATFTASAAKYGVLTFDLQNAGAYSALPSSPVSQGSTSGSGTGFTLTISTWQLQSFTAIGGSGYADGAVVTFTGGAGTGAKGHVLTEQLGDVITIPVTTWADLPAVYNVQVTPNGPCIFSVTGKASIGFNVVLAPVSSSQAVGATAIDVAIFA